MEYKLFILFIIVIPSAQTAVLKQDELQCSVNEFECNNGQCIKLEKICDGQPQCDDGSDEYNCNADQISQFSNNVDRFKRQISTKCSKYQWKCRDGTCIGFDGKCDGMVDCPDGSDETYPLCRNNRCQSNWFRCTYGACVDGTAPCNGIKECADNSDELQPKCFEKKDVVGVNFICQDGGKIPAYSKCDGVKDCIDGSDETIRACAANKCPSYLFQCAYGACVDQGSDCNNKIDCADASDESDELCNRTTIATTTSPPTNFPTCILPPYPDHGGYLVEGQPGAKPGDSMTQVQLTVMCNSGYGFEGDSKVNCFFGTWVDRMPVCERYCKLTPDPSVEYLCIIPNTIDGKRNCNEYEPNDTRVKPQCRTPNYYSSTVLPIMRCIEGSWSQVVTCKPDCGKVTAVGTGLVFGGHSANRSEVPWHVGIYRKYEKVNKNICGGSIVTRNVVLSAAHCFWSDVIGGVISATEFAVAAGKLYKPWDDPNDPDVQKSDVKEIKIPNRFRGVETNFQEDIAVVFLETAIVYKNFIRPVCLDFDVNFNRKQLTKGHLGKVAGWGLTDATDRFGSGVLKVVDLPYVDPETCYAEAPTTFRGYITGDKICAGFNNGSAALCHGDSGGGLTFPEWERTENRYYLRGLVSTAPQNDFNCNLFAITTFTSIIRHEEFIRLNIDRNIQSGYCFTGNNIRIKRAPFSFSKFLKETSQKVEEAVKHVKVEDVKKGWDEVRQSVDDVGHTLQKHVDNIKDGKYDHEIDKAKEFLSNANNQIKEKVKEIDLDRPKEDVVRNWDNIRTGADKFGKIDWGPPGQAFIDNLKDSVAKAYDSKEMEEKMPETPKDPTKCYVPNYPQNGGFIVTGIPDAQPGLELDTLHILFTCNYGFRLSGNSSVICYNGIWLDAVPQCDRFCELREHSSVEYFCKIPDSNDTKICDRYIKNNDIVIPECRIPNYYTNSPLPVMKCYDGLWDYVATCKAVCGKITSMGEQLLIGGRRAERGELPWHVGVYRKTVKPYLQICGGSIVTTTLVVSAAHCFWNDADKLLPANIFAVAAGKLYRPWSNIGDLDSQKSDVKEIVIPKRFRGVETNFQDDIALVFLKTAFEYKTFVRPICVDFETHLNNKQLVSGSVGKVAGWGLTSEDGRASPVLRVAELAYVDVLDCLMDSPDDFREYITSDKFCAGYRNGTALCKGDSGGGLVFAEPEDGFLRYYLRGIVSTAPKNDHACNNNVYTTFTEIVRHAPFIKNYYS